MPEPIDLKACIREVPDFPRPGIGFKDITTLLKVPEGLREAVQQLAAPFRGERIDQVVGIESRGFIFGAAVAIELGAGFVPARKPGKLPSVTHRAEYELEYGTDAVEIHTDAIRSGDRVLIVDDLLATGGTMEATIRLVEGLGGDIAGCAFVVELGFLPGRSRLGEHRVHVLVRY